jgi:hypothetical protein
MQKGINVYIGIFAWIIAASGLNAEGLQGLTPEEASRPWEQWTEAQIREKGWTPYNCEILGWPRAPQGHRWPENDPNAGRLGACVTYSFMPAGVDLESDEGPNTWPGSMPPGSPNAVVAAFATWCAAADLHVSQVTDGGGNWNDPNPAGLVGNIRIGAGVMADSILAHAYYPPPNRFSAAGDMHFNYQQSWATSGNAPGPPYDVQTVALHELGHSFGLDHEGTVPGDVMFGAYTGLKRALSPSDSGFIVSIYGLAGHPADCALKGACCYCSAYCLDGISEQQCQEGGGTYQGHNTSCSEVVCPEGPIVTITKAIRKDLVDDQSVYTIAGSVKCVGYNYHIELRILDASYHLITTSQIIVTDGCGTWSETWRAQSGGVRAEACLIDDPGRQPCDDEDILPIDVVSVPTLTNYGLLVLLALLILSAIYVIYQKRKGVVRI